MCEWVGDDWVYLQYQPSYSWTFGDKGCNGLEASNPLTTNWGLYLYFEGFNCLVLFLETKRGFISELLKEVNVKYNIENIVMKMNFDNFTMHLRKQRKLSETS